LPNIFGSHYPSSLSAHELDGFHQFFASILIILPLVFLLASDWIITRSSSGQKTRVINWLLPNDSKFGSCDHNHLNLDTPSNHLRAPTIGKFFWAGNF
jgi:hypothetical protein